MPKQNSRSLLSLSHTHVLPLNALSLSLFFRFLQYSPFQHNPRSSSGCAPDIRVSCPSLVRKYPSTATQAASFGRLLTSFWELKTISRFQVYRYGTTYMLTGSKRSKLRPKLHQQSLSSGVREEQCITRCRIQPNQHSSKAQIKASAIRDKRNKT